MKKTREERAAELARVIAEYVKRSVESAPPLSNEQKADLARLFRAV